MPIDFRGIPTRIGTLAQRPAASTVGEGSLYIATDTAQIFRSDEVTWTEVFTSAQAGQVLATFQDSGLSTAISTLAVVDPLWTVTFTAPASGKVILRQSGFFTALASGAGLRTNTGVFTHGTTTIVGGLMTVFFDPNASGDLYGVPFNSAIEITGLTPGNSYRWDWCMESQSGSTTLLCTPAASGGVGCPALMTVTAA